jgi:hypothetical protein
MKIIVESGGTRRFINTNFNIYGSADDLRIIAKSIENALDANLAQGWVNVGETMSKDTTPFPFDAKEVEKPVYPWNVK